MKRPRDTAWWRKQQARHGELWQRLLDDPEAVKVVERVAAKVAKAYGLSMESKADPAIVESLLDDASLGTEHLVPMTERLAPELAQFYGEALPEAVWRFVAGHELTNLGVDVAGLVKEIPPLMVQALPDTNILFADKLAIVPPDTYARSLASGELPEVLPADAEHGGQAKGIDSKR